MLPLSLFGTNGQTPSGTRKYKPICRNCRNQQFKSSRREDMSPSSSSSSSSVPASALDAEIEKQIESYFTSLESGSMPIRSTYQFTSIEETISQLLYDLSEDSNKIDSSSIPPILLRRLQQNRLSTFEM